MSVKVEVWGEYACFTRMEFKSERYSYDVPTPSAARGILESVYWHHGLCYKIDRIYVMKPIRFINIKRNEIEHKISKDSIEKEVYGKGAAYIDRTKEAKLRSTTMLRDVHYVIEAHFEMTDEANETDNPGKFQDIIKRRVRKGQMFSQAYLGTRECTAHLRLWEGGKIETIKETRDLGFMLYDMDYSNPKDIQPMFFHAKMKDGVLDLTNCEVVK